MQCSLNVHLKGHCTPLLWPYTAWRLNTPSVPLIWYSTRPLSFDYFQQPLETSLGFLMLRISLCTPLVRTLVKFTVAFKYSSDTYIARFHSVHPVLPPLWCSWWDPVLCFHMQSGQWLRCKCTSKSSVLTYKTIVFTMTTLMWSAHLYSNTVCHSYVMLLGMQIKPKIQFSARNSILRIYGLI